MRRFEQAHAHAYVLSTRALLCARTVRARPARVAQEGGGRTGACLAAPAAAMAGETPTMAPPQATRLPPPSPFFSGVRLLATLCAVGAGVMYDWRAHNGGKDHVLQPLQNVILGLGDFVRAARGAQGREREGVCASLRACTRMRAMHTRTRSCARAFARTLTHTHTHTHVARACTNAILSHSRTYAHACTRAGDGQGAARVARRRRCCRGHRQRRQRRGNRRLCTRRPERGLTRHGPCGPTEAVKEATCRGAMALRA